MHCEYELRRNLLNYLILMKFLFLAKIDLQSCFSKFEFYQKCYQLNLKSLWRLDLFFEFPLNILRDPKNLFCEFCQPIKNGLIYFYNVSFGMFWWLHLYKMDYLKVYPLLYQVSPIFLDLSFENIFFSHINLYSFSHVLYYYIDFNL